LNKKLIFTTFICISILSLAGCGSMISKFLNDASPEDIIEKSLEAHEDVESVQIIYDEEMDGAESSTKMLMDFDQNEANFEISGEEDLFMYLADEEVFVRYEDGYVEQLDPSFGDLGLSELMTDLKNPIKVLVDEGGDISDLFEVEEQDDMYHFTFAGDEEALKEFGKEMLHNAGLSEELDADELDGEVTSLDITLDIDKDTNLLMDIKEHIALQMDDESEKEFSVHQKFEDYNKVDGIEQLEASSSEEEMEDDPTSDDTSGGSDEELDADTKEEMEKEAGEYVDALIQATIFQDQDGFVDAAPSSMSDEEKESAAKTQQEMFKEIYIGNTENNMQGTGVTDEEIENLTDAFFEAVTKTKYEIVDADATSSEEVVVTVSIEGLDDGDIYQKTEEEVQEIAQEGDISQEELVSKNIEILVDNYKNNASIKDPVEREVYVMVDGGQYHVLQQDEYVMDGFVQ